MSVDWFVCLISYNGCMSWDSVVCRHDKLAYL